MTSLRRWAYDVHLLPSYAAPIAVVSVGGLEVGGSGKTPVAGHVIACLQQRGHVVGLATRGYKRRSRGLVVRRAGMPADAAVLGDEAAMLVAAGADVAVAACADRLRAVRALVAMGCDVAVLDDGFVHRRLRRDLDVVVLRREAPFGRGHYLPWGTLREGPGALRRAQAVWLYAPGPAPQDSPEERADQARLCRQIFAQSGDKNGTVPPPQVGFAYGEVAGIAVQRGDETKALAPLAAQLAPASALRGQKLVAAAGLARPPAFLRALMHAGAQVLSFTPYPDHHRYGAKDVAALRARARRHGVAAVTVTGKDWVKLAPLWPKTGPHLQAVTLKLVTDAALPWPPSMAPNGPQASL